MLRSRITRRSGSTPRVAGLAVVLLLSPILAAAVHAQEPRKITVVAKKYEFQPNRIELKVGEPVEITFQSEDTKHGFACKELTKEKVEFDKDHPATLTLTPDRAGTFEFKCAKFCGLGHGRMKGQIVVTQ